RVRVGNRVVRNVDRAGVAGALGAGAVGVDGVGDRAAGVASLARQRRRVAGGAAGGYGGRGEGGRHRRGRLVDRQLLVRAATRRREVLAVPVVDRLPVVAAGGGEADGVRVGHAAVRDGLRAAVRDGAAAAARIVVDPVGDGAAGVGGGARERGIIVDLPAGANGGRGERRRDRRLGLDWDALRELGRVAAAVDGGRGDDVARRRIERREAELGVGRDVQGSEERLSLAAPRPIARGA